MLLCANPPTRPPTNGYFYTRAPRTARRSPCTQGLFRFRIVLPDRKNSAKDMAFCPTESFHTAAQGREHAALLALLKLQEDQPLERKLPEPYK